MTVAIIFVGRLSRAYRIVEGNKQNSSVEDDVEVGSKFMDIFR